MLVHALSCKADYKKHNLKTGKNVESRPPPPGHGVEVERDVAQEKLEREKLKNDALQDLYRKTNIFKYFKVLNGGIFSLAKESDTWQKFVITGDSLWRHRLGCTRVVGDQRSDSGIRGQQGRGDL